MFDRYGPNSLQVTAYIEALSELTPAEFERLGTGDVQTFLSTLHSALAKADGRESAWIASSIDASTAVQHHSQPAQKLIAAIIASMFVVLDRLSHSEKNVIYHSIASVIDYARLFKKYRQEDWAIEYFCEELTEYDGREVYVLDRPDGRGKVGTGLCDAMISRGGKSYVLEHTALNAYINQKKHDVLYMRHIKPLQIEEAIQKKYPKHLVNIYFSLAAFDSKYSREMFKSLKEHLLDAVGQTPESINATEQHQFDFPGIPFPVWISRVRWGPVCTIIPIMPVEQGAVSSNIRDDLARAINAKRNKLKAARASAHETIMLLDAGDELYVDMFTIIREFKQLAPTMNWDGIDQVYLLYGGGTATWALPLKNKEHSYPDLKEYDDYVEWRLR